VDAATKPPPLYQPGGEQVHADAPNGNEDPAGHADGNFQVLSERNSTAPVDLSVAANTKPAGPPQLPTHASTELTPGGSDTGFYVT
jgi:hypothetical protein